MTKGGKVDKIELSLKDSILDLKTKIAQLEDIKIEEFEIKLMLNGKQLSE
jgi:hypothetical protein